MKKTKAQATKEAVNIVATKLKVTPRTARKYGIFIDTSTTCNCGETAAVDFGTWIRKYKDGAWTQEYETAIVGYCQKCGE